MKGFLVDITYRIENKKAKVYMFARLENSESCLIIKDYEPYFFIKESDKEKAAVVLDELKSRNINSRIKNTKLKDFNEKRVVKIITDIPANVREIRHEFEKKGIECYEADIRFSYRFLFDYDIRGCFDVSGEYKTTGNKTDSEIRVDRIYNNPEIRPAKADAKDIRLNVLSIDIETGMNGSEIFCIAMYSKDYKKVLIRSKEKIKGGEIYATEREMLDAFVKKVRELDIDIITGWNVVDFDLNIISKRLKHYKIDFDIGRIKAKNKIRISSDFFRESSIDVTGRAVLDGITLLKASHISIGDYKLESAAQNILGRGKVPLKSKQNNTAGKGNKIEEIERLFSEDKKSLAEYNLVDAELVYKIAEKEKLVELSVERSLVTGMTLERVKASVAALDSLYIREARKRGYVCPSSKYSNKDERIKGGFVMESKYGIYDYIIVMDFKSLYPSIIRTFNIDPLAFSDDGEIVAPNNARFRNEDGILPMIIQKVWEERDRAKKEKNNTKSYALKIIMNSFFGVMANPSSRFFNLDIANAITSFGRMIVKKTAEKIKESGYDVIYGDTDSVFVKTNAESYFAAEKTGKDLQKKINSYFDGFVIKNYNRKSFLELEFEKVYKKFLMPMTRGNETGAKKRYAGIIEYKNGEKAAEVMDVVGLEIVRRDWTELAKKFQYGLLDKVFHSKDIKNYIRKFVADLKTGKYDGLLVYRKAIRKSLGEYTKTTPPHVKAARLLDRVDSNIIEYVMTTNGPEPVQKTKGKIDYKHYIEKQLKPVADSILVFLGTDFESVVETTRQKGLAEF